MLSAAVSTAKMVSNFPTTASAKMPRSSPRDARWTKSSPPVDASPTWVSNVPSPTSCPVPPTTTRTARPWLARRSLAQTTSGLLRNQNLHFYLRILKLVCDLGSCKSQKYKSEEAEVKLCVPNDPKERFADTCKDNYDCGYSLLESGWSQCIFSSCARAIEKK